MLFFFPSILIMNAIRPANMSLNELKETLIKIKSIIKQYEYIIDTYVMDFFVDEIWKKIPEEWCKYIDKSTVQDLAKFLDFSKNCPVNLPSNLSELRSSIQKYSLSRVVGNHNESKLDDESISKLPLYNDLHKKSQLANALFLKIKEKKRHEIVVMSEVTAKSALDCKVDFVIDIGAGLGHLARILSYIYRRKVIAIDANPIFKSDAENLDKKFENIIRKQNANMELPAAPTHITLRIEKQTSVEEFWEALKTSADFQSDNITFGIIGLHPCGDLAPTLIRLFKNCNQCKFINLASCCYMKLTTGENIISDEVFGFPISLIAKEIGLNLSYIARELSCHAIENYVEKLQTNNMQHLKVHAFRAVLEKAIVDKYPERKHCQIRSVKCKDNMTFQEYSSKAIEGSDIVLGDITTAEEMLMQWKRVVGFYCLRTIFAPLIETAILLDRHIFLLNLGCKYSNINAYFDANVSPRVHLLTAVK